MAGVTCANCTIEIFSDNGDEGAVYEGQTIADKQSVFTFNKAAPFIGPHLTATVTDADGNTSEFSRPSSGTARFLTLQQRNDLPKSLLQHKESRELADNRIVFGFYSSYLRNDLPHLDTFAEEIINLGFKRVDTSLTETEPPIFWDFSENTIPPEYDRFIDVLIENGITVNYLLHFWDKIDHPGGEGLARPRFITQEQIQDFVDYIRFIVGHFRGRVDYYTVWSEPDYCGDDQIKCILPSDYINLVRQVVPVIREVDPKAKIVSAPYVLFFAREDLLTLLRSDVVKEFEVISWHPLYDVAPDIEFFGNYHYEYPSIIQEIKATATAHGFQGEYWGTELTWRSEDLCTINTPPACVPEDFPWGEIQQTDLQAAKYRTRGMVMQLGMDVITGSGAAPESPWSYPALRNLNTVMAGNKPLEIPVEIESDATRVTSYGFSLPNDDRLFAVWNDDIAMDYDLGIAATLSFPGTSAQIVIGMDVLHGFEQELIIENENGNLVIRNFLIKDYPIILRLVD